jgi:hypothetical protein
VVRQRFEFNVYFIWSSHGYGTFGVWNDAGDCAKHIKCFERCFLTYSVLSKFCVGLVIDTAEELCSCVALRGKCFAICGKQWGTIS